MRGRRLSPWGLALPAVLIATRALAHAGEIAAGGGLAAGFLHPLTGFDHLLAMVAVGLWGAQIGGRAVWSLPIAFPLVMAFGAILGHRHLPFPAVEIGIAVSVLALGAFIALASRPPIAVATALAGFLAIFHGYAHGAELPEGVGAAEYGAGFILATGLLHGAGIGIGHLAVARGAGRALRLTGAAIAMAGVGFLAAAVAA